MNTHTQTITIIIAIIITTTTTNNNTNKTHTITIITNIFLITTPRRNRYRVAEIQLLIKTYNQSIDQLFQDQVEDDEYMYGGEYR